MCKLHGLFLFIRSRRIRIDTEQERKKRIQKFLDVAGLHAWEKFLQTAADRLQCVCIRNFKCHEILNPAVSFHIIKIHGHQLKHTPAFFQCTRKLIRKFIHSQLIVFRGDRLQICSPRLMLTLQKRKENLLFCLKIIVDRGRVKEVFAPISRIVMSLNPIVS